MFHEYKYIYILGIGGSAMSTIARWFAWNGKVVFGYDVTCSSVTNMLCDEGFYVHHNDNISDIPLDILLNKQNSLVLYTPALGNNDPMYNSIFEYLCKNGYKIVKRSDIFEKITQKYFTIAVAGTHGKTTTTALLADILYKSKKKIVAFIGGILREYQTNYLTNCEPTDDYIVIVEADEYDRFFLHLHYDIAIVTTADPDHLDYYLTAENFYAAFHRFLEHATEGNAIAFVNSSVYDKVSINNRQIFSYGLQDSNIYSKNIHVELASFYFDYVDAFRTIENIRLLTPGYHQIDNAIAVIATCLHLGLEINEIVANIEKCQGVNRRFNMLLKHKDIVYIDDFAHHPVEIKALLQTIRSLFCNKKVTAIFQPHTYTRTRDFLSGFAEVLSTVDALVLLNIFEARERDIYNISSQDLFDRITLNNKVLCRNIDNMIQVLEGLGKPEVVITIGAGNIATLTSEIIKAWILGDFIKF
jgi:UDP-N-acetylmuramate--alanine ligase